MKPLVKTVASTAVVLAALAGCASRSSGGSSAAGSGSGTSTSSPSSSSTSSSTSSSSDGSTSTSNGSQPSAPGSSASSGAPSSGQSSAPSTPGQVKITSPQGVSLAKDGITLITEVEWGGCDDQPQLVVTSQDASKVVVEVKTTNHYRIGIMCPNYARQGSASVKLAAPLGSRQVIDGVKNVAITVH
ncbi:MAG: hypothetical protein JF587_06490 [Catenulisporales bacterium]|jgi:hypothetical protein|nr:hypothetical protein [Catenulisporales bacterium]